MTLWTVRLEEHRPGRIAEEPIGSLKELHSWLSEVCEDGHCNFYVEAHTTGEELTVLLDAPVAAISFMRPDGTAFSASKDPKFESDKDEDYHEFDLGGTPTPVLRDRLLTFSEMSRIVEHVFLHHSLPNWIAWRQP